jgi:hypothetical protein
MMNGCYDMHLYCDTPTCKQHRKCSEFQGINFKDVWRMARAEGWHRHRNPYGDWMWFCGDCKNSPLFTGPRSTNE